MEGLTDIDELILRCRDAQAREYVREAVACYKAGAFRSAIVAAWVAIVYDFLHKLRLLAITGHSDAKSMLTNYENLLAIPLTQSSERRRKLMDFESAVLDHSLNKFEFVTEAEHRELDRLFADRHLCAHPSMRTIDEPFRPSAELARYHIRNAVTLFLQHQPTQGKAAEKAVFETVEAPEFPSDYEKATEVFRHGYLMARPRRNLLRSVTQQLALALVRYEQEATLRSRYLAALRALLTLHPGDTEQTLSELLPRVISETDPSLPTRFIYFVRHIPYAWDLIGPAGRIKLDGHIVAVPADEAVEVFADALNIPGLAESVLVRIRDLNDSDLALHIRLTPAKQYYIEKAVSQFIDSASFDQASALGRDCILPLVELFTTDQIRKLLAGFVSNGQIHDAGYFVPGFLNSFYWQVNARPDAGDLLNDWRGVLAVIKEGSRKQNYGSLIAALQKRFPELRPVDWVDPDAWIKKFQENQN